MKKIGILTFHSAINYGAVLQSYALQEAIKKVNNCECCIIDYTCNSISNVYDPKITGPRSLKLYSSKKSRLKKFEPFFEKYYNKTQKLNRNDLKALNNEFDAFVTGSDQVFNLSICGNDFSYLLDFVDDDSKKFSYAASSGFCNIAENELVFKKKLNRFSSVSIREKSTVDELKQIGVNSHENIDPTLLQGKDFWSKVSVKPKEKNYIAIYTVGEPVKLYDYAQKLSQKTGKQLVFIDNQKNQSSVAGKHIWNASPQEWLGYIENADYVITNSFHGTAFSIIFEKDFFVELETQGSLNQRAKNLLDYLNLSHRLIYCNENPIDWQDVKSKLNIQIEKANEYIQTFLEKKHETKQFIKNNDPLAFAVKHKDENVRSNSRSGGIFTAISDLVLSNNGAVVGCKSNSDFLAEHSIAYTKDERDSFRGSKYIQSDMKNCFSTIKNELLNGKTVMFSGTPCQVDGLKRFLNVSNVDTKNLLTMDIICHGVPSKKVWLNYLGWLESKYNSKIKSIDFRDKKTFGWFEHIETIDFENGKTYYGDIYKMMFYNHHILRPACYSCKYKNLNRVSDITIGDFWGIENAVRDFDDNKGVSLVLVNTEKGMSYFDRASESIVYEKCDIENCIQKPLVAPFPKPDDREVFWDDFETKDFTYCAIKYGCYSKKKEKLLYSLPNKLFKKVYKIYKGV